jgi:hypothetical protein
MMKKITTVCIVVSSILAIIGCAVSKPSFDQAYLSNAVPGAPLKKIDLTGEIAHKMSSKKLGLFGKNTRASLYWAERNALILNIAYENTSTVLYSFLVVPETGEVKLLNAAEKDAFLAKKNKSASVVDTKTLAERIADTARELAAFLLSAGTHQASSSDSHIGKLENNDFTLDLGFTSKKKGGGPFQSAYYDCDYIVTNKQTGNTHEDKVRIDKEVEDGKIRKLENSLKEWLQSWRIAPDGRSYLITRTATIVSPAVKEDKQLIENYAYAGLDINPEWDRIALLMINEDEKTNQTEYWIEFYAFGYK